MARFRVERVRRMVEDDFCRGGVVENPWHGIPWESAIDHLITPPRSLRFVKLNEVGFVWLWAVFDEKPGRNDGYLIVFDPRTHRYGLATRPQGRKYGTFLGFGAHSLGAEVQEM